MSPLTDQADAWLNRLNAAPYNQIPPPLPIRVDRCRGCGQLNQLPCDEGAPARCVRCGQELSPAVFAADGRAAVCRRNTIVACVLFVAVIGLWVWQATELRKLNHRYAAEFTERELANQSAEQKLVSDHQALTGDADYVSGERARRARRAEWDRRMAHDPALARSPIERVILEMDRVGASTADAPQLVLEKVARLCAPRGSEVRVEPVDGKFLVSVAYRLSATSKGESGPVTKHHTVEALRREMQETSARIIRDLYDRCGRRGIQEIRLSCNHAVRQMMLPPTLPEHERRRLLEKAPVQWSVLYRCSLPESAAAKVADWRRVPLHQIQDLMIVDDQLSSLRIDSTGRQGPGRDPIWPLQF